MNRFINLKKNNRILLHFYNDNCTDNTNYIMNNEFIPIKLTHNTCIIDNKEYIYEWNYRDNNILKTLSEKFIYYNEYSIKIYGNINYIGYYKGYLSDSYICCNKFNNTGCFSANLYENARIIKKKNRYLIKDYCKYCNKIQNQIF